MGCLDINAVLSQRAEKPRSKVDQRSEWLISSCAGKKKKVSLYLLYQFKGEEVEEEKKKKALPSSREAWKSARWLRR